MLFKRTKQPIGLALGESSLRMVQLAAPGESRVRATAHHTLPAGLDLTSTAYHEAVVEAMTAMRNEAPFAGHCIATAVPASVMQVKNLRLPPMPPAELAAAVAWEAADRLGLDREAAEIRYFDAGEVRQGTEARREVILLAVPRPFIDAHFAAMSSLGFEVAAIDTPDAALVRSVVAGAPADAAARVIVQIDGERTRVVIARGRRVVFVKPLDAAGRAEASASFPSMPAPDAAGGDRVADLSRELGLCLRYYSVTFRGDRPQHAVLTGTGAHAQLASQLAEQSGLSIDLFEPGVALPTAGEAGVADATPGAWCTAWGMALRTPPDAAGRRAA